VAHVGHVGREGPVDGLSGDFDVGIGGEEGVGRPGTVDWPFFDGGGKNEGCVGPGGGELVGRKVGEARDGVSGGDFGGVGG
jgi:hypothetical protein